MVIQIGHVVTQEYRQEALQSPEHGQQLEAERASPRGEPPGIQPPLQGPHVQKTRRYHNGSSHHEAQHPLEAFHCDGAAQPHTPHHGQSGLNTKPHAASKRAMQQLVVTHSLADVWRGGHARQKQYTWVHSRDNRLTMARYPSWTCKSSAGSTGNRGCIEDLKSKKGALADLLGLKAQGALIRSWFQSATLMDSPTKFFFGLEKKNGQRRMIHVLRSAGGQELSGASQKQERAVEFYSDLYRTEYEDDDEAFDGFCRGSVLKINGGLCKPFPVTRGIRQGCSMSGMLHALAIEPMFHNVRSFINGLVLPGFNTRLPVSAYADNIVIFTQNQQDVDVLGHVVTVFQKLSAAKARLDLQDGGRPGLASFSMNTEAVASLLGLRLARQTRTILTEWTKRLDAEESEMLRDYFTGTDTPDSTYPFPDIGFLTEPTGPSARGVLPSVLEVPMQTGTGFHQHCVLAVHRKTLCGKKGLVWTDRLPPDRKPVWRLFYKPPLSKRSGDLQWRILHGAVNIFLARINDTVSSSRPFCPLNETVIHCYLDCPRL
ncbi:hypothetical protein FQN60_007073, partial [Etheostoma spectabile]